jgi:hypothetical protein
MRRSKGSLWCQREIVNLDRMQIGKGSGRSPCFAMNSGMTCAGGPGRCSLPSLALMLISQPVAAEK